MTALKVAAAAGSGIMAGFYVTFSGVVMPGLRRMAPAQGATAMQRINEQAPKTWVPITLAVTALSVVLAVRGARKLPDREGALLLAGTATFLASVVITFGYHIPRNNRLAALDPASTNGASYWSTYLTEWTTMNHVRALTCATAAACFAAAIPAPS